MRFLRLIIFCIIIVKANNQSYSQISASSHYTRYSTSQGMCDNTVTKIHQDTQGFIWIGTENGLSRFDGHQFITFKHKTNDIHSIPHNRIFDICTDIEGDTWIATSNGLAKFNLFSHSFTRITQENGYSQIPNNFVRHVYSDNQGNVWFSNSFAICKLSKKTKKIELYEVPKTRGTTSYPYIETMFYDRNNTIWLAIDQFLYTFNTKTHTFTHISEYSTTSSNQLITAIQDDTKGNIWIGTNNGKILQYNKENKKKIYHNLSTRYKSSSVISDIYEDSKGNLLISIQKIGIAYFKQGKLQLISNPLFSFIDNCDISCMIQDKHGNYWLGHTKLGISFIPQYSNFNHIHANPLLHYNLRSNVVSAVYSDAQGSLWIGTDGGGLHVRNSNNFSISPVTIDGLPSNESILWIGSFEPNTITIGTYRNGVITYNTKTKTTTKISTHNSTLPTNDIRKGIVDKTNTRWYITHGKGITGISNKKTFNISSSSPSPTQLSGDWTFDALCLPDNSIAVASNYGLNIIHPQRNKTEQFVRNTNDSITLANNTIYCLWYDGAETIWCGTLEGISAFSLKTRTFSFNILQDYSIHSMQAQSKTSLWIGSNKGLHNINPVTHTLIQSFYDTDGTGGNQFSNGAFCSDSIGTVYAGGTHGITIFQPQLLQQNKYKPSMVVSDIKINGISLFSIDSARIRSFFIDSTLELSYQENSLELYITALQYIAPHKHKYSYFLENYDSSWHSSNQHMLLYKNLEPGTYHLYIQSSNNDGIHSNISRYTIHIISPWWQRWWAYALYSLIIIIVIWAAYVYMYISVRNKHEMALEKAKNKHLEELYQAKINFFTNISHDIRTPLTLILSPIQRILNQPEIQTETKELLNIMQRNANQLLQLVNELLDFKKIEAGAMPLELTDTNISVCVEQVVSDFTNQAKHKNIQLVYSCSAPYVYAKAEVRSIQKAVYNLLSNAFKFTPEHGTIEVHIANTTIKKAQRTRFHKTKETEFITISIHDSGAGIPETIIDKIFERFYEGKNTSGSESSGIGLSIVKAIIEQHGGFVLCRNNKGAEFIIHIPLSNSTHNIDNQKIQDNQDIIETKPISIEKIKKSKNIHSVLLVEDNDELRNYLQSFLSNHLTVYTAANGTQGFEQAIEYSPDIILSDIMMPDMDGYELCKKIKESLETSHIPIILLTAKDLEEHILQGYTQGADDYIVKPCNEDVLLLKIQNILQTRRQLQARFTVESKDLEDITSNSVDNTFLRNFMTHIHEHYSESELSVEDIGDTIGISRSNMYRKCVALTGKTPVDILQEVRIQNSIHLLKQTDLTISEIAYKVGYNDPRYFSNRFKKMTGVSPSEIREKQ
ncbi:MAG TPA: two-component regulator propeller domain-containing protein [Bacteroidales bacterium]|nr:two-component regulator propeller domain-containing protein [Bacteroidales bacterium]